MNDIFRMPNDRFHASAGLVPSFSPMITGNNLILPGILLDRVRQSFTIYVGEASGTAFEDTSTGERIGFQALLDGSYNIDGSVCRYPDRALALCMTLCGGRSAFGSEVAQHAPCLSNLLSNRGHTQKGYTQEDKDNALVYYSEVKAVCINRTFVVTEKGFYGLTPLLTGPGDVACVVLGVDVPFILKPCGEVGLFRLLGESYIRGIMEGQVREMVERREVHERSVSIC